MSNPSVEHLTVLGSKIDGALEANQLETFANPKVNSVKFETHEFTSLCPVTDQPDLYTVIIDYVPDELCVESKSLKLYLMKFRNTGIFGEAVAATIANDLMDAFKPFRIEVTSIQQIRGGLQMTSTALRFQKELA